MFNKTPTSSYALQQKENTSMIFSKEWKGKLVRKGNLHARKDIMQQPLATRIDKYHVKIVSSN